MPSEPIQEPLSHDPGKKRILPLTIGALGVVFGDIGTSPLYAMKESFRLTSGLTITQENVLGILSIVFWSLTLIVTIKYITFVFQADNKGEGGITALLALLLPRFTKEKKDKYVQIIIVACGIFGLGLIYGDGVITPAISVLSAVEGLHVATPALQPVIIPITIIILVLLFFAQRNGTARIGSVFGPAMLVWFITIGIIGLPWIIKHPYILESINPVYAVNFFIQHGSRGFFILGAIVLTITGVEALYADMGHFGKRPIRLCWFFIVFPMLMLNYWGQGAIILEKGETVISNPFYGLVSGTWMMYPVIIIATIATVIASQALITGAFSLTQQAIQINLLPRMAIHHTSRDVRGQIYIPLINYFLMIMCISLVLLFKKSDNLAAAYGVAVTGDMLITTCLFFFVMRRVLKWNIIICIGLFSMFFLVDLTFFTANVVKILHGGWIPLLVAVSCFYIMSTWKKGREIIARYMSAFSTTLDLFVQDFSKKRQYRVNGTSVFMSLNSAVAPSVLLHHYKHNKMLHKHVVLLTIITENEPEVASTEKLEITDLGHQFYKIIAHYGFMETPDINYIIEQCKNHKIKLDYEKISYYLGRDTVVLSGKAKMTRIRKKFFAFLLKNSRAAAEYYNLPPGSVIEIGSLLQL